MEADFSTKSIARSAISFSRASMNGVDWAKERDKYAQLVPYAPKRALI